MKKIFNYLKERKNFKGYLKKLNKEVEVINKTPSNKVTEETISEAKKNIVPM